MPTLTGIWLAGPTPLRKPLWVLAHQKNLAYELQFSSHPFEAIYGWALKRDKHACLLN